MSLLLLPFEIINKILEYDGSIKYRNGKYINQISSNDDRYELLKTITPPFVDIRFVPHGYVPYGYVARFSFRIEKWGCPRTTDNPVTFTYIGDESRQYGYIQDDICYKWFFVKLPPKPVTFTYIEDESHKYNSFFGGLYSLFGDFLSHFKSSRV